MLVNRSPQAHTAHMRPAYYLPTTSEIEERNAEEKIVYLLTDWYFPPFFLCHLIDCGVVHTEKSTRNTVHLYMHIISIRTHPISDFI